MNEFSFVFGLVLSTSATGTCNLGGYTGSIQTSAYNKPVMDGVSDMGSRWSQIDLTSDAVMGIRDKVWIRGENTGICKCVSHVLHT